MLITLGSESKSDAHLYSEYVELYETAKKKEAPVLFNGYVAMSKDWDSHRKFNNPTVFISLFAAGFITSKTEIDIELMGLNCLVEEAGKFKYRYPLEPHEISIGLFDIAHGGRWILKSPHIPSETDLSRRLATFYLPSRTIPITTMGYHPRIESSEYASFLTTRSRNSELWFINNQNLESAILGYVAKYTNRYGVALYGLAIEGNHLQGPALFPNMNRGNYMRDLNSSIARAVPRFTPEYRGGRFWARRYSSEILPAPEDIEEYFFYTALQPIKDGLVEKIKDYPGYHFFHDAVFGIERKFEVIRWKELHLARRFNPSAAIKDFTEIVVLKYQRLPGYEHLSQKEYAKVMYQKLEERRLKIVAERKSKGLGFAGRARLLQTRRGAYPKKTKTSAITDHRPRVLSVCPQRRAECKAWYFSVYFDYLKASEEYRSGNFQVEFPKGTYRPYYPPSYAASQVI